MKGARRAASAVGICLPALILAVGAPSFPDAAAAAAGVQDLFRDGDYEGALRALAGQAAEMRPSEEALWCSRLSDEVPQALALLQGAQGEGRRPAGVRTRIALETAELEIGRGRPQAALAVLEPLLREGRRDLPGAVHLRAGLALRATGSLQQARERLTFVRADDPAFAQARYHLGDIALELDDPESALGYFREVAGSRAPEFAVFAEGGICRALAAAGRTAEAQSALARLESSHPDCLALLEIRSRLQQRRDAQAAQDSPAGPSGQPAVSPVAPQTPAQVTPAQVTPAQVTPAQVTPGQGNAGSAAVVPEAGDPAGGGRYCLQFGAFSDRRLALGFQQRHQARIPDLQIDRVQDAQGQFVYKVHAGSYPTPAMARAEAVRLRETLGLDVFVAEIPAGAQGRE